MANPDADRVVSWNAKVGRSVESVMEGVRALVSQADRDVICLQEAGGYVSALRNNFGADWYVYAHTDWDESAMCPVMVRKANHGQKHRGQKDGWDTVRTTTTWVGPQGGSHKGRTWTWVKVSGLWVLSLHRCTDGNGSNSKAFAEEHDKLVKWMGNHQPCLVIGDHNCGPKVDYPNASKLVAQHAGGKVNHPGSGIDYALALGASGTVEVKNSHGSDHPAIIWKRTA